MSDDRTLLDLIDEWPRRPVDTVRSPLLMPPPTARRSDPETSRLAAASVGGGLEALILAELEHGPRTDDELVVALQVADPGLLAASIATARSRLKNAGLVDETGERRPTRRGRAAVVWALTTGRMTP